MLLEIRELSIALPTTQAARTVVANVSLSISEGESLALVGESGSGKSMTARAITRTVPTGAHVRGRIRFAGRDVLAMSDAELRTFRQRHVALIYQDPRAHINPVRRIEDFLLEGLALYDHRPRRLLVDKVTSLLREVGIVDPQRCLRSYPHQLSGGMLQRVAITAALATDPRLLLADEPTTALDTTTQAEVVELLRSLQARRGLALLFITHDLDLAATLCDRTAVMYAGRIVEMQPSLALHAEPRHPYSIGLLQCRPRVEERLPTLPVLAGQPTPAYEAGVGCPFAPRCPKRMRVCDEELPRSRLDERGEVACHAVALAEVACW